MRFLSVLGALGLLLLSLAGCQNEGEDLAPVHGQVFFKGQPLEGGTIVFTPDPDRGGYGPLATGEIDQQGHYTLKTEGQPGAVPGWHRITVKATAPRGGDPASKDARNREVLPLEYSDPERSGTCREVKPGQDNTINLRLD
jgi:hypothetical protein